MNNNTKNFIKLGNKCINLLSVDYLTYDDYELTLKIFINYDELNFKFNSQEEFHRLKSYIKLFSTELECDAEFNTDTNTDSDKKILND